MVGGDLKKKKLDKICALGSGNNMGVCVSLNENVPHRPIGIVTIRRYSFAGGSVPLGGGL